MRCLSLVAAIMAATAGPALSDGIVLTVSGSVEETNRPAFQPFADSFFNFHGHTFENAFAFDRDTLGALPQETIVARAEGWPAEVRLEGPLLADVLSAAGAGQGAITVYALDGYGARMTPDEMAARDWVLAISADGSPLGIGGRGPAWLAYDTGDGSATEAEEAAWVWSVFHIAVE